MKKIIIAQFLISTLFLSKIIAQTTDQNSTKEIGIRMSGLSDFDFIYKKQKAENKYTRLRLISTAFSISDFENFNSLLSLGLTYGREKRKSLNNNFHFINGWEFIGSLSSSINNDDLTFSFSPGVGVVLGFQYEISEKFIVNIETIPSLTTNILYSSDYIKISNLNFGFDTNSIALGLMYKF